MSFDLKSALTTIAPTLAGMLGGPMAMTAVNALEDAFGLTLGAGVDGVTKVMQSSGMSSEVIAAIRESDQKHAEIIEKQGIDIEKINFDFQSAQNITMIDDRKNARAMQTTTRSWVPAALSVIITCGFLGLLTGMLTGYLKAEDNQAMLLMLGALGVAFGQVINFWLGSTAESGRKTEIIAQAPAKEL